MKKLIFVYAVVSVAVLLGIAIMAAEGDDLRLRPPAPTKVKIEQYKPLEQFCANAITRAIERKPSASENVSYYFREMGKVFAGMETNGNFSIEHFISSVDKIAIPLESDSYTQDVKMLIIFLYKLSYEERTRAELPPLEWLSRICSLFRNAINTGLKDSGRVGL